MRRYDSRVSADEHAGPAGETSSKKLGNVLIEYNHCTTMALVAGSKELGNDLRLQWRLLFLS